VRGETYLRDRQKFPSAEPAFKLAGVELCSTDSPVLHISQYLPVVMYSSSAFLMPIHFTLPYNGKIMHLVCVFALQVHPPACLLGMITLRMNLAQLAFFCLW
jgi:hypothetical protein